VQIHKDLEMVGGKSFCMVKITKFVCELMIMIKKYSVSKLNKKEININQMKE